MRRYSPWSQEGQNSALNHALYQRVRQDYVVPPWSPDTTVFFETLNISFGWPGVRWTSAAPDSKRSKPYCLVLEPRRNKKNKTNVILLRTRQWQRSRKRDVFFFVRHADTVPLCNPDLCQIFGEFEFWVCMSLLHRCQHDHPALCRNVAHAPGKSAFDRPNLSRSTSATPLWKQLRLCGWQINRKTATSKPSHANIQARNRWWELESSNWFAQKFQHQLEVQYSIWSDGTRGKEHSPEEVGQKSSRSLKRVTFLTSFLLKKQIIQETQHANKTKQRIESALSDKAPVWFIAESWISFLPCPRTNQCGRLNITTILLFEKIASVPHNAQPKKLAPLWQLCSRIFFTWSGGIINTELQRPTVRILSHKWALLCQTSILNLWNFRHVRADLHQCGTTKNTSFVRFFTWIAFSPEPVNSSLLSAFFPPRETLGLTKALDLSQNLENVSQCTLFFCQNCKICCDVCWEQDRAVQWQRLFDQCLFGMWLILVNFTCRAGGLMPKVTRRFPGQPHQDHWKEQTFVLFPCLVLFLEISLKAAGMAFLNT